MVDEGGMLFTFNGTICAAVHHKLAPAQTDGLECCLPNVPTPCTCMHAPNTHPTTHSQQSIRKTPVIVCLQHTLFEGTFHRNQHCW